jgi:hypothetical protein
MTEEEQIDMQILWLENKVFTNNMEEKWLIDITEQSKCHVHKFQQINKVKNQFSKKEME